MQTKEKTRSLSHESKVSVQQRGFVRFQTAKIEEKVFFYEGEKVLMDILE